MRGVAECCDAPTTRAAFREFLAANPGTARLLYHVHSDADIDRELPQSVVIRLALSTS